MKKEFKVGDRVIANGWQSEKAFNNEPGVVKVVTSYDVLVEFDRNIGGHDGYCGYKKGHCWYMDLDKVELATNEKIIIYRNGDKVVAKNTVTKKTAEAKCHADDTFDFAIGAKLAFERLLEPEKYTGKIRCIETHVRNFVVGKLYDVKDGKVYSEYGLTSYNYDATTKTLRYCERIKFEEVIEEVIEEPKPKYYNGKVVCVKGAFDGEYFTTGKIYKVVDGIISSNKHLRYNDNNPYKNLDDLNKDNISEFIEVVE